MKNCLYCNKELVGRQRKYCSKRCKALDQIRNGNSSVGAIGNQNGHGNKGKPKSKESVAKRTESIKKKWKEDDYIQKHKDAFTRGGPPHIRTDYQKIAKEFYKIECCGCDNPVGTMHVHHLNCIHEDNSPENLVWLCTSCHMKIHGGRTRKINEEFMKEVLKNRESRKLSKGGI